VYLCVGYQFGRNKSRGYIDQLRPRLAVAPHRCRPRRAESTRLIHSQQSSQDRRFVVLGQLHKRGALIPVAWIGRTSTEDKQDPTLSLPRQLEKARSALPSPFVIVAHFYDVESGRAELVLRGHGTAHEQFDIPIPRDGGIADALEEARRSDRRFVAVVCESVERIARVTYVGTKIEYELEQAGVPLLAADEGIDPQAVLTTGGSGPKKATWF
jgi:hypothetical protein